jgi:hypothetical protein
MERLELTQFGGSEEWLIERVRDCMTWEERCGLLTEWPMSNHAQLPDPDQLQVVSPTADHGPITLTVRTCGGVAWCPIGGQPSSRVRSRYRRTLADRPWQEPPPLHGVPHGPIWDML